MTDVLFLYKNYHKQPWFQSYDPYGTKYVSGQYLFFFNGKFMGHHQHFYNLVNTIHIFKSFMSAKLITRWSPTL
jgi:hypothetical protein